ncbi:CLUMA_CG004706, isoform A [Clunio marinus]|uniref:CLUMA_CG004706, isoform A n=1 Tax=Clunio marinus TaxID=568069 RepID=A0A1J1HTY3_9DIPT|nr:CLUMA_CG004706, isoform A [Clunio marinus]
MILCFISIEGEIVWRISSADSIPINSIPAGKDNNETLYACRAWFVRDLTPGKLSPGRGCVITYKGITRIISSDYDVATGTGEWVTYDHDWQANSFKASGINGRRENLFVCRIILNGNQTPGKFNPNNGSCCSAGESQEYCYENFEVLIELPVMIDHPTIPISPTPPTAPSTSTTQLEIITCPEVVTCPTETVTCPTEEICTCPTETVSCPTEVSCTCPDVTCPTEPITCPTEEICTCPTETVSCPTEETCTCPEVTCPEETVPCPTEETCTCPTEEMTTPMTTTPRFFKIF